MICRWEDRQIRSSWRRVVLMFSLVCKLEAVLEVVVIRMRVQSKCRAWPGGLRNFPFGTLLWGVEVELCSQASSDGVEVDGRKHTKRSTCSEVALVSVEQLKFIRKPGSPW